MEQNTNVEAPVAPVVSPRSDKPKNGNGLKIVAAVALVAAACGIGLGVYGIMQNSQKDKQISDLKIQIEEQAEKIANLKKPEKTQPEEDPQEDEPQQNKAYRVGDLVKLSDGTSWNVLKNSGIDEDEVTLLSVENVDTTHSIKIIEVKNYLLNDYKDAMTNVLGTDVDVRLLTLGDISQLSGIAISDLIPGHSIENGVTPAFLYKSDTLIADDENMILGDNPDLLCSADVRNSARICMSTQTDREVFRPVITIDKKALK